MTSSKSIDWYNKHSRRIEIFFVVFFSGLLLWSVADWLDLVPGLDGYKPLRTVLLSCALLVQSISPFATRRSRALGYSLLVISIAFLVAAFVAVPITR